MIKRLTPTLLGWFIVVLGVISTLVSLLADLIGLGHNRQMYGRYQFIGTALGLILIVIGTSVFLMDRD